MSEIARKSNQILRTSLIYGKKVEGVAYYIISVITRLYL